MTSERDALVDEILEREYTVIIVRDREGTYSSEVLEFPGCFSSGQTIDEAARNIREAMALWVESELGEGRSIPRPLGSRSFSGRLQLRLPSSLHARAAKRAMIDGTSLNQLILTALSREVGSVEVQVRTLHEVAARMLSSVRLAQPEAAADDYPTWNPPWSVADRALVRV